MVPLKIDFDYEHELDGDRRKASAVVQAETWFEDKLGLEIRIRGLEGFGRLLCVGASGEDETEPPDGYIGAIKDMRDEIAAYVTSIDYIKSPEQALAASIKRFLQFEPQPEPACPVPQMPVVCNRSPVAPGTCMSVPLSLLASVATQSFTAKATVEPPPEELRVTRYDELAAQSTTDR